MTGSRSTASRREGAERKAAHEAARSVDVRPDDPNRIIRTLSGGNQQKVVLARWLLRSCKVLLLDEPTRGVDVGARAEIYTLIRELADSGVALVVVSSDIEEVLGLSDRVLVVADGRVVHDGPSDAINPSGVLDRILAVHDRTPTRRTTLHERAPASEPCSPHAEPPYRGLFSEVAA